MRVDVYSHRKTSPMLRRLWEQEFETDMLRLRRLGRRERLLRHRHLRTRIDIIHHKIICMRCHVVSCACTRLPGVVLSASWDRFGGSREALSTCRKPLGEE